MVFSTPSPLLWRITCCSGLTGTMTPSLPPTSWMAATSSQSITTFFSIQMESRLSHLTDRFSVSDIHFVCVFHDVHMSIMVLAGLKNVVWNGILIFYGREDATVSLSLLFISKQHVHWKWLQPYLLVECCENRGVHMYVP